MAVKMSIYLICYKGKAAWQRNRSTAVRYAKNHPGTTVRRMSLDCYNSTNGRWDYPTAYQLTEEVWPNVPAGTPKQYI